MIIYTHPVHLFAMPFLLAVGLIDLYLLVTALRLITAQLASPGACRIDTAISQFTDPLPNAIRRWLQGRTNRITPAWAPWLIVIGSLIVIRSLLCLLIFR